jgi:hypothetical protein
MTTGEGEGGILCFGVRRCGMDWREEFRDLPDMVEELSYVFK